MLLGAAAQSIISYSGTSIKLCFHFIPMLEALLEESLQFHQYIFHLSLSLSLSLSPQTLAFVLHFVILTTLTPIDSCFILSITFLLLY